MRAKAIGFLALAALLCGGCGTKHEPFVVVVQSDAAAAARRSGVDLQKLVTRSAEQALALLPHRDRIRIEVRSGNQGEIPQLGVGGHTTIGGVEIQVDPNFPRLREALERWLPPILAHELDHVSRHQALPRAGGTLGDALVSEGLADRFAMQVFPRTRLPWDHALSREQEQAVWSEARRSLFVRESFDPYRWFFGAADLPRWAGYTLGYDIVGAYLARSKRSAAAAVRADTKTVLGAFRGF